MMRTRKEKPNSLLVASCQSTNKQILTKNNPIATVKIKRKNETVEDYFEVALNKSVICQ